MALLAAVVVSVSVLVVVLWRLCCLLGLLAGALVLWSSCCLLCGVAVLPACCAGCWVSSLSVLVPGRRVFAIFRLAGGGCGLFLRPESRQTWGRADAKSLPYEVIQSDQILAHDAVSFLSFCLIMNLFMICLMILLEWS